MVLWYIRVTMQYVDYMGGCIDKYVTRGTLFTSETWYVKLSEMTQ